MSAAQLEAEHEYCEAFAEKEILSEAADTDRRETIQLLTALQLLTPTAMFDIIIVFALGAALEVNWLAMAGAILVAHTGIDRLLGYGLKYPTSFQDTHLGRIGKRQPTSG